MKWTHWQRALMVGVLTGLAVSAMAQHSPSGDVLGMLGLAQAESGSCLAVWVPVEAGMAIRGVHWYNNDGTRPFPEVLVQSGTPEYPVALPDAEVVATDVTGASDGWSGVEFSSLVGSLSGGVYVIFRVQDGAAVTDRGAGGGPAIGYVIAAEGCSGWMSADGIDWEPVHPDYGFAVEPVLVAGAPEITLKARGRSPQEGPTPPDSPGPSPTPALATALHAAAPNPFNPQTTLRFTLSESSRVDLAVFDLKGALVRRLVSAVRAPGEHTVRWDGLDDNGAAVASGVYLGRLAAGPVVMTQRLVLIQ